MRQVNPLYIALMLIAVLAVVGFRLDGAKQTQLQAKADLEKTQVMAKRIDALKKSWDKGKMVRKELDRLLKSSPLRNAGIESKEQRGSVSITAKKIDAKAAEYLLNKLLNGTYVIKTLSVKRLDAETGALHVEVAL